MQVQVEAISSVQKKLSIEIPADQVSIEIEKVFAEIQKKAKLQGFRPGKAPLGLIKRTYADSMKDDVMRRLFQQTLYKAIQENNLEPLDSPVVESGALDAGSSFKYTATFDVMPEIILNDYRGLEVKKEKYHFKQENIDAELERMRENMAQLTPLDEDAVVDKGHVVTLEYSLKIDGTDDADFDSETIDVEIGTNRVIPGFEEQVIGMKSGEQKKFVLDLPKSSENADDKAKRGNFSVVIKEIKSKELPELNDEFAQQFGDYDSIVDLRTKLSEYQEKQQLDRINNDLKERIVQELVRKNPVEVPSILVKRQLEYMFETFKNRLKNQQMSLESLGLDESSFRSRFKDDAAEKVKGGVLLTALVEKENITVTEEDLAAQYEKIASGNEQMLERIRNYYAANAEAKNSLNLEIKEDKAIAYLIDNAVIVETEP